jgi:hypothetical protein
MNFKVLSQPVSLQLNSLHISSNGYTALLIPDPILLYQLHIYSKFLFTMRSGITIFINWSYMKEKVAAPV